MNQVETIAAKLPPLVDAYIKQETETSELYDKSPDQTGLDKACSELTNRSVNRNILVKVLIEQAKNSSFSNEQTLKQIDLLLNNDVATVTTGHQLCIYGGPMFFFYKILSVISLSQKLNAQGKKVVPVFWMASEDHDFEEINHIYTQGKKLQWTSTHKGPVGRMALNDLIEFKVQLKELFQDLYSHKETIEILDRIFSSEKNLSQSIRDFAYWIFADHGLVVIDADDARLKALLIPVIQKELFDSFSSRAVREQTEKIESLGHTSQVTPRDINLFWSKSGYRERIVKTEKGFATVDLEHTWTNDEIKRSVEQTPEYFSPNVILRPLYQEIILPNIAYIGGPGETSYWLQLKKVFEDAMVPMPVVLIRDMFLLVESLTVKKVDQLNIKFSDIFQNRDELIKILLRRKGTHEHIIESRQSMLEKEFAAMSHELSEFDPSLEESSKAELKRLSNKLNNLKRKVIRADKRQNEVLLSRLDHVYDQCFYDGAPQERMLNWLSFWGHPKQVFELLPMCNPLKAELKVVCLD